MGILMRGITACWSFAIAGNLGIKVMELRIVHGRCFLVESFSYRFFSELCYFYPAMWGEDVGCGSAWNA